MLIGWIIIIFEKNSCHINLLIITCYTSRFN